MFEEHLDGNEAEAYIKEHELPLAIEQEIHQLFLENESDDYQEEDIDEQENIAGLE